MPPRNQSASASQNHPHKHSHAQAHSHAHPRSPNEHLIQFYNGEESLFDAISSFILPSFFSSEHAAVIVATKPHLEALDLYLRQQNLVPDLLRKREQMFLAPAEMILEQLMPNGIVESKIFFDYFGPLFEKLQKRYPRLLVYGELVNILCENGEHEKAHELEEVWESFLEGKDAALLCGYNLNVFANDGLENVFQRICRSHSHVTPAEGSGGGTVLGRPEDQQMVLAMLQQKNLRLEAEMGRRAAVETALRSTLDHLGTRSTEAIQIRERDGATAHIQLSPVGVMAATTIDGITDYFFNSKFLELTGLTSKSVRMDPGWVGAVHYQDRERVSHNIRLVDGKPRRLEYRFVRPDGSIRCVVGESVSRESGYVHSAVDISDLRSEAHPPPRPRNGSMVGREQGWQSAHLAPPNNGWKRDIGSSRISSPSGPTVAQCHISAIFTRSRPNDQKISQDLTKVSQILWENLFPHPNPDPAESIIATRLSTLYSWFRSQPRAFLPDTSTFDINNDALQKANIRLSHAAYFGAIILLSRFPLIRSIERGDLPRDTAQSQRESASGRRKGELDDLQYAEGCIDAAYNAVNHVHTLISQKSHSGSTGLAFSDNDATVKDIGSCRMVLGVFFISVLTILLHISLQSAQTMDARQNDVLEKISQVIAEMDLNTDVQDMSRQHRARLRTFLDAISARSSSHYSNYSASFRPPSSDSISPLGISGKRLTADLIHMLQQPQGGVDWLAYHSPLWCWKDLLTTPGALPVGGRLIEPSPKNSDRTLRSASGESGSTPPRGLDKRAKRDLSTGVASDVESLFEGERGRARESTVSKELEALFKNNNPPHHHFGNTTSVPQNQ